MMESIEKLREFVDDQFVYSGQAYFQGMAIAGSIEREIESRYMLLPVDADGVPIHVGDRLTNINKPSDEYIVAGVNGEKVFVYGGHAFICASQCRHVKQRTIEDVLREFVEYVTNGTNVDSYEKDIADYADELRELMEVDK